MCNLFTVKKSPAEVARHFGIDGVPDLSSPKETVPRGAGLVVRRHREGRSLHAMSWGFPRQTPEMRTPSPVNLVADLTNPMWETMVQDPRYRCLIPVTAFAEPTGLKGAKRRSWYSVIDEPLFAWAGFCRNTDVWGPVFAGMTTDSNTAVEPLNPRMPVLLYPHEYDRWLTGPIADVLGFQNRSYPSSRLSVEETDDRWVSGRPLVELQATLF
jgi:putative SOS response-associated peptidase YedK